MSSPVTYIITLADLVTIADAACDLVAMKAFYVDRPDEQALIARRVQTLSDIVERAAAASFVARAEPQRDEALAVLRSMFNEFGEFEYNIDTLTMARAAIAKAEARHA